MSNNKVVFEIELEAETPLEAATIASDWLKDSEMLFYVKDENGDVHSVDLSENEGDEVLPVHSYTPLIIGETYDSLNDNLTVLKAMVKEKITNILKKTKGRIIHKFIPLGFPTNYGITEIAHNGTVTNLKTNNDINFNLEQLGIDDLLKIFKEIG